MDFKKIFGDFEGLKKHISKSEIKYLDALKEYYILLGEQHDFTVSKNTSIIRKGFDFGKIDIAWVEPNIIFAFEFGTLDDIYKHLFRLSAAKAAVSVLILNSKSQCHPEKVEKIIKATDFIKEKFIIVDLSNETVTEIK